MAYPVCTFSLLWSLSVNITCSVRHSEVGSPERVRDSWLVENKSQWTNSPRHYPWAGESQALLFSTSPQWVFTEMVFKLPIAWFPSLDWPFFCSCFNFSTSHPGSLKSVGQTHYWSQAFCLCFSTLGAVPFRWVKGSLWVSLPMLEQRGDQGYNCGYNLIKKK